MAMPVRRQEYQTTTVRIPRVIYEEAKTVVRRCEEVSSVNEFIVEAVRDKLREISEADIDAAFLEMANDPNYVKDSIAMAREFEKSDWDALQVDQSIRNEQPSEKAIAHARSR